MANTWGSLSWGEGLWGEQGDNLVLLTGQGLTVTTGTAESEAKTFVAANGLQINLSTGQPFVLADANTNINGIELTVAEGSIDPAPDAEVTGEQLNIIGGDVSITTEINTGWGRLGWGVQDWGTTGISVSTTLTGSQINLSLGNETVGIVTIASPNGNALAFALSGVDPSPDAFASGTQLPIQVGSPFIIADSNLSVTGNEITLGLGTAQSSALTIASPSGLGLVTPAPGTVVVGGIANVPVSGNELTAATGEVDVAPDVALTGQQINVTTGTVVADAVTFASVTGLGLNTTTGTVSFTITGSVLLTGNQVNIALGNEVSQVWTIVDTGTTVAYTEVSTGSSVNWNIIDTAA